MPRSELRWLLLLFAIPFVILVSISIRHAAQNRQTARLIQIVQWDKNFATSIDSTDTKISMAQFTLAAGADPNGLIDEKTPLIRYAARKADLEMVELLKQNGAKTDLETENLIKKATKKNQAEYLIELDKVRIAKLCDAIANNDVTSFNKQIGTITNIDGYDDNAIFPLQVAIENNDNIAIPLALLAKGANVRRKSVGEEGIGIDLIPLALLHGGNIKLIEALQKAGSPISPTSALTIAVIKADLKGMRRCIHIGVDVDKQPSPMDWTPLQWAAYAGYDQGVELLLKSGANPLLKPIRKGEEELSYTPLELAGIGSANARTRALLKRAEKDWTKRSFSKKTHNPINFSN